jgi:hypothetical protein
MKKICFAAMLVLLATISTMQGKASSLPTDAQNVVGGPSAVTAKSPADSVQLSLLTCSPGKEIYNLFGHTAIRYKNTNKNIDVVFNYGMFDFRKPHFVLRFTLGHTDYELGAEEYADFEENYALQGRSISEQVLHLTPAERDRLFELLMINYQPENRTYRYNFFYDNCSTRPRDKIEQSIAGKVVYPPFNERKSYRDIIHQYTVGHPWARFGIDLCLGAAADRPITQREMMFCPFYLRDFVDKAVVVRGTSKSPLVDARNKLLISSTSAKEGWTITPFQCTLLFFIILVAASIYGLKKKKSLWFLDVVVFAAAGLAGCIIAFLMLFSTHPTVSSNFLIIMLQPFYLFCLPWMILSERMKKRSLPMLIFCVLLTLFIVLYAVIPQKFDFAVVPLALGLWCRTMTHLVLTYKKKA